jgi:hypothetical protein
MIRVAETRTYQLGRYTVRQQPHWDNPAFAQYLVFLDDVLIGKCFSSPGISDCDWLEHQQRNQTMYAYSIAPVNDLSEHRRGRRPRLAKAA